MFFPLDTVEEAQLTDIDHYAVIQITGKDALEFLSNQFTNDLKTLQENTSSLGAWCSVKGRVLFLFRIWRQMDDFFLILPTVHTENFLKRLNMYILRAEVKAEVSTEHHLFGLSGKEAEMLLTSIAEEVPEQANKYSQLKASTIIKIPAPVPRYLIITKEATFEAAKLEPVLDKNTWQLLDIMAGIPEVHPDTSDKFLPQMLDLETLGGLSFQKGCYPGQEIVARVKYRGELKKQLYQASVVSSKKILPGASLQVVGNNTDHSAGFVVSSASLCGEKQALLAIIDIKTASNECIQLAEAANAILTLDNSV